MSPIRRKRSDTNVGTIEEKYNLSLGVRSDMKLGTYLKREGLPSLSKVIQRNRKNK